MMDARTFLGQAELLEKRIRVKQDMLADLKALATRTSSVLSPAAGCGSGRTTGGSVMSNAADRIVDLEREIEEDVTRLVSLKSEIMERILSLENPAHQELLNRRYLHYQSLNTVAAEMQYCYGYVKALHRDALNGIETLLHLQDD